MNVCFYICMYVRLYERIKIPPHFFHHTHTHIYFPVEIPFTFLALYFILLDLITPPRPPPPTTSTILPPPPIIIITGGVVLRGSTDHGGDRDGRRIRSLQLRLPNQSSKIDAVPANQEFSFACIFQIEVRVELNAQN